MSESKIPNPVIHALPVTLIQGEAPGILELMDLIKQQYEFKGEEPPDDPEDTKVDLPGGKRIGGESAK